MTTHVDRQTAMNNAIHSARLEGVDLLADPVFVAQMARYLSGEATAQECIESMALRT